jgi:hypothetical protein
MELLLSGAVVVGELVVYGYMLEQIQQGLKIHLLARRQPLESKKNWIEPYRRFRRSIGTRGRKHRLNDRYRSSSYRISSDGNLL